MALTLNEAKKRAQGTYIRARLANYSQKQQDLINLYGNYNQADWHTQDEANAYYNALQEVRDLTDLYRYYVDTYDSGNKALSSQLGSAVGSYDDILSGKNDFLDMYSQYTNPKDFNADIERRKRLETMDINAAKSELEKLRSTSNWGTWDKPSRANEDFKKRKEQLEKDIAEAENIQLLMSYENLSNNPDFVDVSSKRNFGNPTREELEAYDLSASDASVALNSGGYYDEDGNVRDRFGNIVMYAEPPEITDKLGLFLSAMEDGSYLQYASDATDTKIQHTWEKAIQEGDRGYWGHINEEEKAIYYYLKNTEGDEAAYKYLDDMAQTFADREAQKIYAWSSKNLGTKIGASLLSIPTNLLAGTEQALNLFSGEINHMSTATTALRSGASSDMSGLGSFLYNTGMSGVDSMLASLMPGYMGETMLALSAAGQTQNDILARGGSKGQAIAGGIAAGVFEALFEHVSLGKLRNMDKKAIKSSFSAFAKELVAEAGVNASEEAATELANILSDAVIMDEMSNFSLLYDDCVRRGMSESEASLYIAKQMGAQVAEAAASGALMGMGFTAIGGTYGTVKDEVDVYRAGKNILDSPDAESIIEEYKYAANEFKDVDSVAKAAKKYEKKATASRLGRLEEEIRAESAKRSGLSWEQKKKEISKAAAEEKKALAERASADVQKTMSEAHSEAQRLKISSDGRSGVTLGKMPAIVDYSGASSDKIMIKDADGNAVKLSEAELADDDVGVAYILASQLGSVNAANAFIKAYNSESEEGYISPDSFYVDWLSIQSHGQISTWDGAMEKAFAAVGDRMSEASKGAAFLTGRNLRESASKKFEADQAKYDKAWKEAGGKPTNANFNDAALRGKTLSKDQQDYRSFLRVYSRAMGTNVEVFYSEKGARKENGSYNRGTNTLRIDINAGIGNKATYDAVQNNIIGTLSHETVHNMRVTAPKQYEPLRDFVTTELEKNTDYDLEKNVEDEIARYAAKGKKISREDAIEEIVARACEDRLGSSEALRDFLADLYAHDKDAANGFVKAVKEFLARLKEFFEKISKMKSTAPEAQKFAEMGGDIVSELQKLFDEGVLAMREGNMARNAATEVNVSIDPTTESASPIMLSEATWRESEYVTKAEQAAEALAKALDVTTESALKYINNVNSIAKMIANDRARLDYVASSFGSAFVSNVEYGGSFDYTTLCKKRRLFTGTFSEIQKRLGEVALTPDQILEIRNLLIDAGLEAPCGRCYVEGSRANMGKFAKEFIKLYKRDNPNAWIPNMADVNTPDGVEQMRIKHPECYERYEYFWNHYGKLKDSDPALFASQQKPKLYEARKAYAGEILKQFSGDTSVEKKNRRGGIRMQSFSDFEIIHAIDTMQVIMDMSRVGLAGQAYTKVPEFAKAFGDTGLKINLSLIAKGIDENGKLIFDDREGMPHETAFDIRKKHSKNVGTIIVVFNDKQLYAAMADDRIDFIIPFHRSQWKKGQYAAMGLPEGTKDYTYMQNEKLLKQTYHEYQGRMVKDKASNYMPNEYWHPDKTGKENAELYLQMCADNNKRPKFYKLLDYDGKGKYSLKADGSTDGYWKLLIDFKMYDNDGNYSPQLPVTPDFNMTEIRKMMKEYEGGHRSYPIAHDIVDKFVEKYTAKKTAEDYNLITKPVGVNVGGALGATMFQDRDSEYLEAVNRGDMEKAQRMVDEAAKEAGYSTEHLYHGTSMFGFTDIDVSSASDDSISFFATNRQEVASGYMPWYEDDASDRYHNDVRRIGVSDKSRPRGLSRSYSAERILAEARKVFPEYNDARVATDSEILADLKTYWLGETVEAAEKLREIELSIGSIKVRQQVKDMCDAVIAAGKEDTLEAWRTVGNRYKDFDSVDIPYDATDMRPNIFRSRILGGLHQVGKFSKTTAIMLNGQLTSTASIVDRYNSFLGGDTLGMYDLYAKQGNQLVIQGRGSSWNQLPLGKFEAEYMEWLGDKASEELSGKRVTTRDVAAFAKAKGYRSVVFYDIYDNGAYGSAADISDVYAFFYPNEDVKSADPITYDDNGNVIPLSERFNTEQQDIRYQDREFSSQVDDVLNGADTNSTHLKVMSTPTLLQEAGLPNLPILMTASHLKKITAKSGHGLDVELVKKLPNYISDPVMIADSLTRNDSIVIFTEAVDSQNRPVIAAILLNGTGRIGGDHINANIMTSAYGRNNVQSFIDRVADSNSVIYWNEKKSQEMSVSLGVQFPNAITSLDSNTIIRQAKAFVNTKSKNISDTTDLTQRRDNLPSSSEILADVFKSGKAYEKYAEHSQSLKKYKDLQVRLKNSEKRIAEIDDEIKKLRSQRAQSGKGTRMDELYRMRKTAENKVENFRKQMFEMEAGDLYNVVISESKRLVEEQRKADYEKYREKSKERTQNISKRGYIEMIEKRVKRLKEMLLKNSADKHIPEAFKLPISELVTAIDFSSKRSLAGGEQTKQEIALKKAVYSVKEMLAKMETSDVPELDLSPEFKAEWDYLSEVIDALSSGKGTNYPDQMILELMNTEDLGSLNKALKMIEHAISNANKLIVNAQFKNAIDLAESSMQAWDKFDKHDTNDKQAWIGRFLEYDNTTPINFFERLGTASKSIFEAFMDGQDKLTLNADKILAYSKATYTEKQAKKWSEELHYFNIDGVDVFISTAQLMSLYKLNERDQAKKHLLDGGGEIDTLEKANWENIKNAPERSKEDQKVNNSLNGFKLTQEAIDTMTSALTQEQKDIADKLQDFMRKVGGNWGDEIHMVRYGIRFASDPNYFPAQVSIRAKNKIDDTQQGGSGNQAKLRKILNISAVKALNENANERLLIRNIFDVFSEHMSDMATYNALALPLLDMLKWYNYSYRITDDDGKHVTHNLTTSLEKAYGKSAKKYLDNFIEDINNAQNIGRGSDFSNKMISNYKVAAVAANLRVVLLQPTSLWRALNVLGFLDLTSAVGTGINPAQIARAYEKAKQNTPLVKWKALGFHSLDVAMPLNEQIKQTSKLKDKIIDASMKGAEWGDNITIGLLWIACERRIKKDFPNVEYNSAAFKQKVSKLLREVIYKTQVVDTVLSRSDFMRNKNGLAQVAASFMAEGTQSFNAVQSAFMKLYDEKRLGKTTNADYKIGAKRWAKTMSRPIAVFALSAVFSAIIESLPDAMRDDDDEKEFYQKYLGALIENGLSELNPINKLPIFKEFASVVNVIINLVFSTKLGVFSSSRMDTAFIESIVSAIQRFGRILDPQKSKDTDDYIKFAYQVLKALSQTTGLPLNNLVREVMSMWNTVVSAFDNSLVIEY